jgi:hypothetical protein
VKKDTQHISQQKRNRTGDAKAGLSAGAKASSKHDCVRDSSVLTAASTISHGWGCVTCGEKNGNHKNGAVVADFPDLSVTGSVTNVHAVAPAVPIFAHNCGMRVKLHEHIQG